MSLPAPSSKAQIILAAERLFARHGIEGVSLRQIGAEAGNGNKSAVQYHFGTKDSLLQAIFEYRLPGLYERRRILVAQHRPHDLRAWVLCYVLPILEQGEQKGSHYLTFVNMLRHHGRRDVFERLSDEFRASTREFYEQVAALLPDIPEPLRAHRISQAVAFGVDSASNREHAQVVGYPVLPFAVHVADLLDGLVGFLQAPASPVARAVLDEASEGDGPPLL
ncbi:TetR/AcrR family transcriptional regulator [Actinomadura fibrosa]|uniref:TetR/AcrR family transcriptional regulator n=1 Tax=Actinomadura fibrosa TaxID=111802 RepID=A0ABW2XTR6_9ACTN|nr:TetR/AcrR family transcriptional regulator [Actinomadura fibrosa]